MIFIGFASCGKSHAEQRSAAALLAEKMILKYTGQRLKYGDAKRTDKGKPYFEELCGVDFSISHSESLVMCAVSVKGLENFIGALPLCGDTEIQNAYFIDEAPGHLRVGADIELVTENKEKLSRIARRYFTLSENDYIADGGSDPERFFETWTKKESLGKMLGTGLSGVLYEKNPPNTVSAQYKTFKIKTDGGEYIGTVCFGK